MEKALITDIESFFEKTQLQLADFKYLKKDVTQLKAFPVTSKQCLYVINWKDRTCLLRRGVKKFLGYNDTEFTFDFILKNYHPQDLPLVLRIIKAGVNYCINNDVSQEDFLLFVTYRVKKKDDSYIKVMRQSSMFETDLAGKMISNLSLLTDISFLDTSDRIDWTIQADNLNTKLFKQEIYQAFHDFFTPREKDIIRGIAEIKTTLQIAECLRISKHTAATHRKNILRKSNCSNRDELLSFAHKYGVLV
jgi:DNA-binding CsgD family transcriptional regulator